MTEVIDFLNITIDSCKFMQLTIICQKIYVYGFDRSTSPILQKIEIQAMCK